MARRAKPWIIGVAAAVLFLYVLFSIALEPAATTDLYPRMSTLRADPVGAKALFDSIAELPGMSVQRSFRPIPAATSDAAVILLGFDGDHFRTDRGADRLALDKVADGSGRLIVAFAPELPEAHAAISEDVREAVRRRRGTPQKKDDSAKDKSRDTSNDSLATRFGVLLKRQEGTWEERADQGSNSRETALYFEPVDPAWTVLERNSEKQPVIVERPWKKGSVLLVARGFPLSNEGLRSLHNTNLIATMIGPFKRVVFSESHLGLSDSGSVGGMLRRYGMQGAALMLIVLGLLFIWKMSSSLLPPKQIDDPKRIEGQAASDGLAFLIRRAIPKQNLLDACWQEWERASKLLPYTALSRQTRAKESLRETDPVRGYKNIQKALSDQS